MDCGLVVNRGIPLPVVLEAVGGVVKEERSSDGITDICAGGGSGEPGGSSVTSGFSEVERLSSIRGCCKENFSCGADGGLLPASDCGGARVGSLGRVPVCTVPAVLLGGVVSVSDDAPSGTLGYNTCCADGETTCGTVGGKSAWELEIGAD